MSAVSETENLVPSKSNGTAARWADSWQRQALILIGVAAVYFAAAKLGLAFAYIHTHVSPIWPPTGIAIAAVLLFGNRVAPAIFIAAFLANANAPVNLAAALAIALGNTLEAVVANWLLRLVKFHISFGRARDVFKFVVVALLCTTVSATIGTLALSVSKAAQWNEFGSLWVTWWLGDLAGAVTVAPLVIAWAMGLGVRLVGWRLLEAILLVLLLSVSAMVTYGAAGPAALRYYPLARLIIPFLIWASFRLGHRGLTLAIFLMSIFAAWGTVAGSGPFIPVWGANESLIVLQLFISTNAVTFLFLTSVVEERRRAEESLRGRESELQLITEATPLMLTRCSRDLKYVFANRAYASMLGLEPHEIIGKSIVEVMGNDGLAAIRPHIDRVLRGEQTEYEQEIRFKAIGSRYLRAVYRPDKDKSGATVGWMTTIMDLTDRWLAENAQRRTETELNAAQLATEKVIRHLAAIVENTDDVIIGRDLNGLVTSWNAAAEALYGYEAAEMIGKPLTILIPPDRPNEEPEILHRLRQGERIDHYETIRRAKDGRLIPVSLTVSAIKDPNGDVIGLSKIARDITDRKKAEAERDALLKSEHAARAQAEEANRVKDEFLAVLSHELRTPLNAILGWANLLRSGKLDPENVERALEIVERNAKAQSKLIEGVLDVSRIVSGKLQLDVRPLQLSTVIQAAIDSIRPAADAKNMSLRVITPGQAEPLVRGDSSRLQQVVWNLLSNAVKFSPAGDQITVELRPLNSHVEILVQDRGQGIPGEFLPHVFDRFRQADSSTTRQHGGLGLGLAIVRHLIELHGGTVSAESDGSGKGATFRVRLPAISSRDEPSLVRPTAELPHIEPKALAGLKILVVDDHEDGRDVLAELLSMCDAEVKVAGSAAEALTVVGEWVPQIVVSDISMPEVDGYAFIRQLRALEGKADIPAIAVTAHALAEDHERVLAAGFQSHLAKPVQLFDLIQSIAKITGRDKI